MWMFDVLSFCFFFFKQKTAYEMRISDWSSDVCSSDLLLAIGRRLNFQIDKPRPLAPLGLEDRGVDLLSYRRANRGTDRTSDDPAHHRQHHHRLAAGLREGDAGAPQQPAHLPEIERASCRERVCQNV